MQYMADSHNTFIRHTSYLIHTQYWHNIFTWHTSYLTPTQYVKDVYNIFTQHILPHMHYVAETLIQ